MKYKLFTLSKISALWIVLILVIYCVFVLSYVWWQCFTSPWLGGKNGQLDAYRHTLASAVVAYTTSPKIVILVTSVMERKGNEANLMDRHNNAIGAQIGNKAESFSALKPAVLLQISQGTINASHASQTTWLPQEYWDEGFLW